MLQSREDSSAFSVNFHISATIAATGGDFYTLYEYKLICLDHIFNDLITLYKFYSTHITQAIQKDQSNINNYQVKRMRAVRRDILKLFSTFLTTADPQIASQKYLPGFGNLLTSYQ